MSNKNLKNRYGQNTTEYIIMVVLVAIGSIIGITSFGKQIHTKLAYMSAAISGDTAAYNTAKGLNKTAADNANTKAGEAGTHKMEGIEESELESSAIN